MNKLMSDPGSDTACEFAPFIYTFETHCSHYNSNDLSMLRINVITFVKFFAHSGAQYI